MKVVNIPVTFSVNFGNNYIVLKFAWSVRASSHVKTVFPKKS